MKLSHLHLEDPYGNKKTLTCRLVEGSISYSFYGSHSSSGTPFSLSNLQCSLPVDRISDMETKEQFQQRIIDEVNTNSVCRVVNVVSTQITFNHG
mgnify:FL=1